MIRFTIQTITHYHMIAVTDGALQAKWVRALSWLIAVTLGALHGVGAALSQSMNPDGVAYLDIGDAYARGDWHAAVSTYWSPLYSWMLAVTTHVLQPSIRWEFPTIHLLNFVIYVIALICFERFWFELGRYRQARSGNDTVSLPEWAWLALGYSLFLYSALSLIRVWSVTPDMLVAALVYAAAALVVRVRAGRSTWRTFAWLGTVLGFGYLAKTAMFPLAFVFLGVTLFSVPRLDQGTRFVLIALTFLMAIAGPYVGVLSAMKGNVTFGDTGRLMYAWHVNAVPHPHWQGNVPGAGTPKHGSRRVFESPAIYEFGRPARGTYPVAYDPAYWYEGVTPHFEWKGQARVLAISAQYYFDLFVRQQGGLVVGILVLYYLGMRRGAATMRRIVHESGLAIIALVALAMYALVHVQGRYIGAFVVLLWGDLLASVRLPASEDSRKWLAFVATVMLSVVLINIVAFNLERGGRFVDVGITAQVAGAPARREPDWPGEIAEELYRLGLRPGDSVGAIGYAFDAYWARLARVQIVAEMFDWEAEPFWSGSASFQSKVLRAFAGTGAKAIVAERVPVHARADSWYRVGSSDYYIYVFGGHRDAISPSHPEIARSPS